VREIMREIKFRGKRLDNGEWVYGYYYTQIITHAGNRKSRDHFMRTEQNIRYEVDPDTVGQYTGLKDKNGKEIYEGDIVESFDHGQVRQLYLVKFNKGCFGASLDNISFYFLTFDHVCVEQIKIIGNIYENPDLLSAEVGE
jgi:uncharacterized phage protein (TIGR01671 family)